MAEPSHEAEPRADAEAVVEDSSSAVATTAARALALGAALATPAALHGIRDDLAAIGLAELPKPWGGWERRTEFLKRSSNVLAGFGILDAVQERERADWMFTRDVPPAHDESARVALWQSVAADASRATAIAWLRVLMTDREPTAAAAAAAALAHWKRKREVSVPATLEGARRLVYVHAGSQVAGARQIARAARGSYRETGRIGSLAKGIIPPYDVGKASTTSLIVHGTHAWPGAWWFVGGDFHTYIRSHVRPDVFSGRNAFSWSGAYKGRDRHVAAERLAGWAQDTVGGSLNAVFAHSYGGAVALHATAYGLVINDLVLLSAPVEAIPVEWRNVGRATSLRIHMDLVLLAARRRQRFTENVEEHHLPRWFWHHCDSHDPHVWRDEDCVATLRL
ncbi:MAG TPA: hypothetical protein VE972_02400 [Conexibacter sp.]|nr:hypothetical protein [Conexibacter sp.]